MPGRREGRGWLLSHTRPLHGLFSVNTRAW
eukprot:SAG31_NODE_27611_length_423_cov_0.793210_1_plen_29_part_10